LFAIAVRLEKKQNKKSKKISTTTPLLIRLAASGFSRRQGERDLAFNHVFV